MLTGELDVAKVRSDFPMLSRTMHGKPLIYLDSAATAQKPQAVIDCVNDYYRDHCGTVHRAIYELSVYATQEYSSVRGRVAAFMNAEHVEEIIFTRGTTESINMVAYSFGKAFIQPGDEVLISEMEHHSNIVPWQMMCEDRGAVLRVAPINDRGELILDEFAKLLNHKTKIVAITHISNALGTINPIKEIATMVHQTNAKLLVDGAQAAPHLSINVQDLDVDFYVFSGHKVYGPTGIGVLYGKKDLLNAMPPYQGGGDMIETVTFEKTTYNVLPMKFEAGTPMIAQVIGLGAAIDYMKNVGLQAIENYEQSLYHHAMEGMSKIEGIRFIGTAEHKASIISFLIDGLHPLDVGTMLDLKGIALRTGHLCAQPVMRHFGIPGTLRASFAFYNTKEEVDRFIVALQEAIRILRV